MHNAAAQREPSGIEHRPIEYRESGSGPAVVLVPGSCSTGAAWRPVISELCSGLRCVTTSLLGYGDTGERRTIADTSIDHECDAVEEVIARAGGGVHLVGHSFGGLVALAVALRGRASLFSLTIFEAPAVNFLHGEGDECHYGAFRDLTDGYFDAYRCGNAEAIAAMIDFYGGAGTFASWPARFRAYAAETTPVNMLDWASAFRFVPSKAALSALALPTRIVVGANSHPSAKRANQSMMEHISGAELSQIEGAAHFMIATHPRDVARIVSEHVARVEASSPPGDGQKARPR